MYMEDKETKHNLSMMSRKVPKGKQPSERDSPLVILNTGPFHVTVATKQWGLTIGQNGEKYPTYFPTGGRIETQQPMVMRVCPDHECPRYPTIHTHDVIGQPTYSLEEQGLTSLHMMAKRQPTTSPYFQDEETTSEEELSDKSDWED